MSTNNVRFDASAKQAAKFIVVVVLPTPPFWFAMAIILLTKFSYISIIYIQFGITIINITKILQLKELFPVSRETKSPDMGLGEQTVEF